MHSESDYQSCFVFDRARLETLLDAEMQNYQTQLTDVKRNMQYSREKFMKLIVEYHTEIER